MTAAAGAAHQRHHDIVGPAPAEAVVAGAERPVDGGGTGFPLPESRRPFYLERLPALPQQGALFGLGRFNRLQISLLGLNPDLQLHDPVGCANPVALLFGHHRAGQVELRHHG